MGNKKSTLRPEIVKEIQEHTNFTFREVNDLYRQFLEDSDGHLEMTKDQFISNYQKFFPEGDGSVFAEHIFRTFDTKQEGRIDFRQFITTLSIQLKGDTEQKLNWAFDLYDIQKTNTITWEEAVEIITLIHGLHIGAMPKEEQVSARTITEHLFKKADEDKDRIIHRNEFIEAAAASKTIRYMLRGVTEAAVSPYVKRKISSGSYGKPRTRSGTL